MQMLREQCHTAMTMAASEYCKLVFDISQQLRTSDVEALQYIYKINVMENCTNLGVLKCLEKRGVFSSNNSYGLKSLLRTIDRCDLLDMLKVVDQDKRLELCYLQAVSLEQKLEAIRVDLMHFTGKQECSPTERSFCSVIMDRLEAVQKGMKEYLTQPLEEVYQEKIGEWDSYSCMIELLQV